MQLSDRVKLLMEGEENAFDPQHENKQKNGIYSPILIPYVLPQEDNLGMLSHLTCLLLSLL